MSQLTHGKHKRYMLHYSLSTFTKNRASKMACKDLVTELHLSFSKLHNLSFIFPKKDFGVIDFP